MPQSLSQIYIHLIFSTKNREPLILDAIRDTLHSYIAGVLERLDSPAVQVNTMPDHAHILFSLSRNATIAKVVHDVKRATSGWVKTQPGQHKNFYWQHGYGAFSVSASNLNKVIGYIQDQEKHHQNHTFQSEFLQWLKRYRIRYDPKYVWD